MNIILPVLHHVIKSLLPSALSISLIVFSFTIPRVIAMEHELSQKDQEVQLSQSSAPSPQPLEVKSPLKSEVTPEQQLQRLDQEMIGQLGWGEVITDILNSGESESGKVSLDVGSKEWHHEVHQKVFDGKDAPPVAYATWYISVHNAIVGQLKQPKN